MNIETGKCKELRTPDDVIAEIKSRATSTVAELGYELATLPISVGFILTDRDGFQPLRGVPFGGVYSGFLSQHNEQAEKNFNGLTWADMAGHRADSTVKTMAAFVHEFDNTASDAQVRACIDRSGFAGVVWNTFNHGRDGAVKLRAVTLTNEPVPISEVGQDGWRELYTRVGRKLYGDLFFDPANKNPSRIHWNPARPIGSNRGHRVTVHRGKLFDWRAEWKAVCKDVAQRRAKIEAERERRARERENKEPSETLSEIADCLEHIPASLPYPDWFRVLGAIHHETEGSQDGLDLAHDWSSGDARYDFDEVERIWDSLDPDHRKPSTMGTLVKLSHVHNPTLKPSRSIRRGFQLFENMKKRTPV